MVILSQFNPSSNYAKYVKETYAAMNHRQIGRGSRQPTAKPNFKSKKNPHTEFVLL